MVDKGPKDLDPRGLIFESFRIDGITGPECRSIFFDWAMSMPVGDDMAAHITALLAEYRAANEGHPMIDVLEEGLASQASPARRGGRKARVR